MHRFVICPKCNNPIIPGTRYRVDDGKAEHVNCLTWHTEDKAVGKEYPGPKSGYIGH